MRLCEIVGPNDDSGPRRELEREIRRSLQRSRLNVDRDHLLQTMYGGPDETERESLELERIRSEIAVKRADAIRNLAQAETAHSPIQMHSGLNDEQFFEIYRDARCQWRWMLISENGSITATSGEGYKDEATCRRSISFLKAARFAQVVKR